MVFKYWQCVLFVTKHASGVLQKDKLNSYSKTTLCSSNGVVKTGHSACILLFHVITLTCIHSCTQKVLDQTDSYVKQLYVILLMHKYRIRQCMFWPSTV